MSRGGLIIFNWANQNAEKVACIYGDAPVCDFKSWPMGNGAGEGNAPAWKTCLEEYGFTEEQALAFKGNPIDHMENIAKAKIPILNMVGDADKVVPVAENTNLLQHRLNELGWDLTVLHKPNVGHHPHSLKDPKPIVDFILRNTGNKEQKVSAEPEWSKNNINRRSNFQNCKIQFEQNKTGHVAFLGGSITEMNGYRPMLCEFLEDKFPSTEFTFTNAGIASTGSTTGAFRMERDVLSEGPLDLLFVEFAVNDDQDGLLPYNDALMGMEAIVRKARKHNPNVDIVMTYFVNPNILNDYQKGIVRTSIAAHNEVAQHYGISTCNLAKEVADQITIGTLDWETFGGTHPHDFGNRICANMISSMLEDAWTSKEVFKIPAPINALNFENGKLVNPADCDFDKKWSYSIPDWENIEGSKRDRFTSIEMLCTTQIGAELTFNFEGTAVGAFIVAGPDAGIVEVSIDGGDYQEFDLYHKKYSKGLHYPRTVMFAKNLNNGEHSMKLRMSKKTSGKGTAARIMDFVVN
jgi:lysophospholipase L1-like esterase